MTTIFQDEIDFIAAECDDESYWDDGDRAYRNILFPVDELCALLAAWDGQSQVRMRCVAGQLNLGIYAAGSLRCTLRSGVAGVGLYALCDARGGLVSVSEDDFFQEWLCVLQPDEFSVRKYALDTPAGMRAVREYVRRRFRTLALSCKAVPRFVIIRLRDGRVVAEGSNACRVVWTKAASRARLYPTEAAAHESMQLLCDYGDGTYVTTASVWSIVAGWYA